MPELRPAQAEVLAYRQGTMGIAAVPGSGKTFTLSLLAVQLLTEEQMQPDQELLVVTLVNSAVDNFRQRIGHFIQGHGLLPNVGYRVRTLHGLAHDIVLERPGLVGLSEDFQILDERETRRLRESAVAAWMRAHPGAVLDQLMNPELLDAEQDNPDRTYTIRQERWPRVMQAMAADGIKEAKNRLLTAQDLSGLLDGIPPFELPLLQMVSDVYRDYERALTYRGAIDFDDLIRLAIQALQFDPAFRERLARRWPYILEDEAQDSSALQEQILALLAGPSGNWVRVGDPNQAIYETFTTASPEYLKRFIREADVPRQLPNSGRSTVGIQNLANFLIRWTAEQHPNPALRESLVEPLIEPTPPGDPQPNPDNSRTRIEVQPRTFREADELAWIARHVGSWLPEHPQATAAVLVPTNDAGAALATILRKAQVPFVELLRSTSETRRAVGALTYILRHLAEPLHTRHLSMVYEVWHRTSPEAMPPEQMNAVKQFLRNLQHPEAFIWPRADQEPPDPPACAEDLDVFRARIQRWQQAAVLPVDQLLLTIAQDLFRKPSELALAHKLAVILVQAAQLHPAWGLAEVVSEFERIAKNERNFIGFSEEDSGFDPDRHRGKVLIATYHKAKGLEWDRVYLTGMSSYSFPSALPEDRYRSDRSYLRQPFDLTAEAIEQLETLLHPTPYGGYDPGAATAEAKVEVAREALRRLYVGITRARHELFLSWNTGRFGNNQPALALTAIQAYLQGDADEPA